jgi:hypothetical protein
VVRSHALAQVVVPPEYVLRHRVARSRALAQAPQLIPRRQRHSSPPSGTLKNPNLIGDRTRHCVQIARRAYFGGGV